MKTVVITGASSGIGHSIAKIYCSKGWQVVMIAHKEAELDKAVDSMPVSENNLRPMALCYDLSNKTSRVKAANDIKRNYPVIDLLINNAGAVFDRFELTDDCIEKTIALNYLACFHLSYLLLPQLQKATSATILNITSKNHFQGEIVIESFTQPVAQSAVSRFIKWIKRPLRQKILFGILGTHLMTAYSQSKLAQVLFTISLAEELKSTPVKVNCIHPGIVKTRIGKTITNPLAAMFWQIAGNIAGIKADESANQIFEVLNEINRASITGAYFEMNKLARPFTTENDIILRQKLQEWSINAIKV